MQDYLPKTEFFPFQGEDFLATRDESNWAVLYEMGLGKTKQTIDTAAWMYAQGTIDFVLVIAPNGVHTNWIEDELPAHMPEWTNHIAAEWGSNMKAAQKEKYEAVFESYKSSPRLRILAMNVEAFGIQKRYFDAKAGKLVRAILNAFRVLMVVDESITIKTPGAQRTRRIITLGKHATARRILNGAPITEAPFDLYGQFKFVAGDGPPLLGPYSSNFASFKHRYGVWEEKQRRDGRRYPDLKGYQNLDELAEFLALCSTRRTKAEELDLPPKLYEKLRCELHKEQARLYKRVKDEAIIELRRTTGGSEEQQIDTALVQIMRLQQIIGGFVPTDDPENRISKCIVDDPMDLPRVQLFRERLETVQTGKAIIYCEFLSEVRMWKDLLGEAAAVYVGKAHYKDPEDRERNKVRFQGRRENEFKDHDPDCRYMIMNKAGARGITLTHATAMLYYTNGNSLDLRLQSEDRPHRIGQENAVLYMDGVTPGCVDEKIVAKYREKKRIADLITGDNPADWL